MQKDPPHHFQGYMYTPAFWDSLSKIWLTREALKELNRRNNRPSFEHRNICQPVSTANFLRTLTPERLKDVKRFARGGGPDLSDLVGCPEPAYLYCEMSPSRSSSSRKPATQRTVAGEVLSAKSKRSTPYDANYQQKLIDGGVFPYGYRSPDGNRPPMPSNWNETIHRLQQRRPSLSPSVFPEELYQKFVEADADAFNEDAIKETVLPAILEAINAPRGAEKDILFTNMDSITGDISYAKPDYYYGSRPKQIHPYLRDKLSKHIIPSNHTHLPALPNFFLEVKGPDGSAAVARRQACHNGAIGARAIQSIRSFGQSEPVFYDNSISSISTTYHEGTLKVYGHSIAQPKGPGTMPEYYMCQLGSFAMTNSVDTFREGATAFKNALAMTEEYRKDAITQGNRNARRFLKRK